MSDGRNQQKISAGFVKSSTEEFAKVGSLRNNHSTLSLEQSEALDAALAELDLTESEAPAPLAKGEKAAVTVPGAAAIEAWRVDQKAQRRAQRAKQARDKYHAAKAAEGKATRRNKHHNIVQAPGEGRTEFETRRNALYMRAARGGDMSAPVRERTDLSGMTEDERANHRRAKDAEKYARKKKKKAEKLAEEKAAERLELEKRAIF